jgi:hypothetical protein
MSKPNQQSETENKEYTVMCWQCQGEFFTGTVDEIKEWEKKTDEAWEDLNYDELEDGTVGTMCEGCAYAYHL